jgi:hypothetical protein
MNVGREYWSVFVAEHGSFPAWSLTFLGEDYTSNGEPEAVGGPVIQKRSTKKGN